MNEKGHFIPYSPEARAALDTMGRRTGPFQVHPAPLGEEGMQRAEETVAGLQEFAANHPHNSLETAACLLFDGVITDGQFVTLFEDKRRVEEGEAYQPLEVPAQYHVDYQRNMWATVAAMERRGK